jgi:hypothetical protein
LHDTPLVPTRIRPPEQIRTVFALGIRMIETHGS